MKAVGYKTPGPIDQIDALKDITLPSPSARGRALLVKVHAVSVNPVDTKLRRGRASENDEWNVLGFDASGVVVEVGEEVRGFGPGDAVYYAGSIARPGTNSELHLVDERIVAKKPTNVSHAQAAALPLTAITAWEMLFERLDVNRPTPEGGKTILVIGGSGGVGSITLQLLRALTDFTVIATASRPVTKEWVRECGAHHVIDHRHPLAPQVEKLNIGAVGFVFSTTQSHQHCEQIVELIAPQGRFGLIDDPPSLDFLAFKRKSVSLHWELMFTRSLFQTSDMHRQGELLAQVAELMEQEKVKTTLTEVAGTIDAETLKSAHARIESGTAHGKIVLEGF